MIVGITDRSLYESEAIYLDKIDCFLKSDRIDYMIIREPSLDEETYERLLQGICQRNKGYQDKIIVHRYCEIALKMGIKRVHLPESLAYKKKSNKKLIYSLSLHPIQENLDQVLEGIDFFLVSPIYESTCKPGVEAINTKLVKKLQQRYPSRMVLLGGLNKYKIQNLRKEGYKNFALRSGLEDY